MKQDSRQEMARMEENDDRRLNHGFDAFSASDLISRHLHDTGRSLRTSERGAWAKVHARVGWDGVAS